MEEHVKTNDDTIIELREKIDQKKEKLYKKSNFYPLTNCIIEFDNKISNIRVMSKEELIMLLIKLNTYSMSAVEIDLIEECNFSGFNVSEWISDIHDIIKDKKLKEEMQQLKTMEDRLKKLLTNEKKVQLEIDELTSNFENM